MAHTLILVFDDDELTERKFKNAHVEEEHGKLLVFADGRQVGEFEKDAVRSWYYQN